MAGAKGRSGGSRTGAGAKKKSDLAQLHAFIDAHVGDADWASMIGALKKKAKQGNVQAFRELRASRFGHLPLATQVDQDQPNTPIKTIVVHTACTRKHADDGPARPAELPPASRSSQSKNL